MTCLSNKLLFDDVERLTTKPRLVSLVVSDFKALRQGADAEICFGKYDFGNRFFQAVLISLRENRTYKHGNQLLDSHIRFVL